MQLWKWRTIGQDTTPLEEFIRWCNQRFARLAGILELHHNALRTVNSFSNGVTQPSVYGAKVWIEKNTVPTTITAFRDGEEGQDFYLIGSTANTTIQHGANIKTKSGVNVVSSATSVMHFVTPDGVVWREI